jgi:3-oxoacyl-[acyl-carrier protein] reductase
VDLELAEKTVIVCGGSRGLGRAIAGVLVAEGARVLVVSRDPAAAAAELGAQATLCPADLATPEGVDGVVAAASSLGGVDGLLVNTGGPPPGLALDLTDEQWDGAYRSLIGNPIRLIRALRPRLSEGSSILFVTSSSARVPIAGLDTSNILRPGVTALVKCLALELAPQVRVNSIVPGRIDTERVRYLDSVRAERTRRSGARTRARSRWAATATSPSSAAWRLSCSRQRPRTSRAPQSRSTAATSGRFHRGRRSGRRPRLRSPSHRIERRRESRWPRVH